VPARTDACDRTSIEAKRFWHETWTHKAYHSTTLRSIYGCNCQNDRPACEAAVASGHGTPFKCAANRRPVKHSNSAADFSAFCPLTQLEAAFRENA
jgi:hypothetical protein